MRVYVFKINNDHAVIKVPAASQEAAQHKLLMATVGGQYLVQDNKFTFIHMEGN